MSDNFKILIRNKRRMNEFGFEETKDLLDAYGKLEAENTELIKYVILCLNGHELPFDPKIAVIIKNETTPMQKFMTEFKGKKICRPWWANEESWIIPLEIQGNGSFSAKDRHGIVADFYISPNDWKIWEEPTKGSISNDEERIETFTKTMNLKFIYGKLMQAIQGDHGTIKWEEVEEQSK